jgi:hypothetical protein
LINGKDNINPFMQVWRPFRQSFFEL